MLGAVAESPMLEVARSVACSGSQNARQNFRQTQNYVRRFETRLRGAATPAARCGSGQWRVSEVLSVVPRGGSSETVGSVRLRIDWDNRRVLVRVTRRLDADPDPELS
jgi:hypothetical protein